MNATVGLTAEYMQQCAASASYAAECLGKPDIANQMMAQLVSMIVDTVPTAGVERTQGHDESVEMTAGLPDLASKGIQLS